VVAVEGSAHSAAGTACLPTNRISSRLYLLITWPLRSRAHSRGRDEEKRRGLLAEELALLARLDSRRGPSIRLAMNRYSVSLCVTTCLRDAYGSFIRGLGPFPRREQARSEQVSSSVRVRYAAGTGFVWMRVRLSVMSRVSLGTSENDHDATTTANGRYRPSPWDLLSKL